MTGSTAIPAAAKRVFQIAWPAIGDAYLQNLLGVVDAVFIARIGLVAIDAVGVTNVYSMTYTGVFIAVSAALSVFLSRAVGAKDYARGRAAITHGLLIAFILGLILSVLSVFLSVPLLHIMGARGALRREAFPYFVVVLDISPIIALFTAQSAAFRAIGGTRTPLRLTWSMTKFAVPAAVERLSMRLGQVIYFGLIVRMGVDVYATHNIAGTLTAFASTIGGGFATAATATIGQSIGSGNEDDVRVYRRWCYIEGAVAMTGVTILLCLFSPWLGLLFTHNPHVVHLLFIILAIDVFSQPFLAAVLVDTSAIQAGGNSRFPMITTMIGIWCIRTLGVYVFAWRLGFGLPAVWVSIAADNALRAGLFLWYRRTRNWVQKLA